MTGNYDPCKCGSGKKYKWCCLKQDREQKKEKATEDGVFQQEFEEHLYARRIDKILAIISDLDEAGELSTPDAITVLLDRLIYHDLRSQAIALTKKILPRVAEDSETIGWVKENFEDALVTMMILEHLDERPRSDTKQLLQQIDQIGYELDDGLIPAITDSLDHWSERKWSLDEFALDKINPDDDDIPDALSEKLFKLGYDFVGFANQIGKESTVRANFAAVEIITYLLDRACGILEDESHEAGASMSGSQFFCPDAQTLGRYFESKVFALSKPSFHAAAMILDLLPTWMKFIVDRKLIGEKRAGTALASLMPLADEIYRSCTDAVFSTSLASGRNRWDLT